jgi:hypothetical protein
MPKFDPTTFGNIAKSKLNDFRLKELGEVQIEQGNKSFSNAIEKSKQSILDAKLTQEELSSIIGSLGPSWPQTKINPDYAKTQGFLPTVLLKPSLQDGGGSITNNKYGNYTYKDWRGYELKQSENTSTPISKFQKSKDFNKKNSDFIKKPYSMRDVPLIFGDSRYDYFRYGLQTVHEMGQVEDSPLNGTSDLRLSQFKETPYELNDPVIFGFDVIIEAGSSPLLNGSVLDFLNQYKNVNELGARINVYEEFKNQFIKFFRLEQNLQIDDTKISMTGTKVKVPYVDSNTTISEPGKKAHMAYYLKKVGGLDLLIESNKGDTFKYLSDWKKDMITLDFNEDVSLSVGTLAHLYKLLYWSKPQGKMMVPENLLRFNCQIIISECRNFNRVRKDLATGNLEILKDNLSRYVYSLKECQFYFDKMPHGNDIDMGDQGPDIFSNHTIQFDYKYSSVKLERFVPVIGSNWGKYVGYDSGAIWKIGNPGERSSRTSGSNSDSSVPKFFTSGFTPAGLNGVVNPFVINLITKYEDLNPETTTIDIFEQASKQNSLAIQKDQQDQQNLQNSNDDKESNVLKILSELNINKIKNFVNDVTGFQKTPISRALNTISPFFNKMLNKSNDNKSADTRKNLLNNAISKAYSSQLQSFTEFKFGKDSSNSTEFFDKKGNLKDQVKKFGGGPLGDNLFGG